MHIASCTAEPPGVTVNDLACTCAQRPGRTCSPARPQTLCGVAFVVLQVDLGMQRTNELMKICNKFMLRRTSTVLKALLPAKVEQVCGLVLQGLRRAHQQLQDGT